MADRNKNLGQSNQDWDQNRKGFNQENDFNQRQENMGNTGYGFYDQNTGVKLGNSNAGYSGQVSRGRETESQGIYNSGGQYNTGNQNDYNRVNYFPDNDENRNYNNRDYENNQYGTSGTYGYKGNKEEYGGNYNQGSYGNRSNYGNMNYGNDYNRQDLNQGYGQQNYKSDFEKHYYNQQAGHGNYADGYGNGNDYNRNRPVNRYGGDTRNYGNANQGGFDRDWWDRTKDEVASWFGDDEAERRRKMDRRYMSGHRGKGPKNYHRSEERIREDVCDRLADDDMVDASEIEVQVQGTEVVLTGYVPSREQKRRAEDIVESVSCVRNVENRLRVGQGQTDSTTTKSNIGTTGSELT